MRLGVSKDLGFKEPMVWAEKMRSLGCGSVVFPLDYTSDMREIHEFADAAKKYGLTVAEVGVWCNPLSENPVQRKEAIERCKGQLRLADEIGANCCVNVAGTKGAWWAGAYKENFSRDTWKQTVSVIQEIIDDVHPKHTYYAVEPMPAMFPMDPDQYLELIKCVDRERFAVHMDVFNWITDPAKYFFHEEFMEECFDKLKQYIKSCHLKDTALLEEPNFQLKEVPCGEGKISLEKYASLAEDCSPDMPMIIEHLKTKEAYVESVRYVRERLGRAGIVFR